MLLCIVKFAIVYVRKKEGQARMITIQKGVYKDFFLATPVLLLPPTKLIMYSLQESFVVVMIRRLCMAVSLSLSLLYHLQTRVDLVGDIPSCCVGVPVRARLHNVRWDAQLLDFIGLLEDVDDHSS